MNKPYRSPLPEGDNELTGWEADLAQQLAALRDLAPPPSFGTEATSELLRRLPVRPHPAEGRRPAPLLRLSMRLATAFIVLILVLSGTGFATAASLPGDPLYLLKRRAEMVQLVLSTPDQQADLARTLTERRLEEVTRLVERGAQSGRVVAGIDEYRTAAAALGHPPAVEDGAQLLRRHLKVLAALEMQAPADARTAFQTAQLETEARLGHTPAPEPGASPSMSEQPGQPTPTTTPARRTPSPTTTPAPAATREPPATPASTPVMEEPPTPPATALPILLTPVAPPAPAAPEHPYPPAPPHTEPAPTGNAQPAQPPEPGDHNDAPAPPTPQEPAPAPGRPPSPSVEPERPAPEMPVPAPVTTPAPAETRQAHPPEPPGARPTEHVQPEQPPGAPPAGPPPEASAQPPESGDHNDAPAPPQPQPPAPGRPPEAPDEPERPEPPPEHRDRP